MSTIASYTGDGVTRQFDITFAYRQASTVYVSVNGEDVDFTFVNSSRVETAAAPANGSDVRVYRRTAVSAAEHTFNDTAILHSADLNDAIAQVRERAEELESEYLETVGRAYTAPPGELGGVFPARAALVGKFLAGTADGALIAAEGTGNDAAFRADMAAAAGAALVGFVPDGVGATQRSVQTKLREIEISVTEFGVSHLATAAANLANFKKAVTACPVGARLRVPPAATPYLIDTLGGLSAAIVVNKRITLVIDGDVQASGAAAIQANPPYIFNVTAAGVKIEGCGRIIGDGTINDLNAGTDETLPGLIRVAANDFKFHDVEIVSPPKVGILLYQCYRANIGARFTGGPTAYNDTAHFAIRAVGGGRHQFIGNQFYPDAGAGMFVQCIFTSGSAENVYIGNHATHPYEKLIYAFDSRSLCQGNIVVGNPGAVPGTNIVGSITAPIRFHGSDNLIEANRVETCAGGVQVMDGSGNAIIDNLFLKCGQSAISVYQAVLTRTVVRGNVCTAGNLAGFVLGDGIRVVATGGPSLNLAIDDNTVTGFSTADPIANLALRTNATAYGKHSVVKPTVGNGRYYVASTGGVSGGSEPAWPTTPGDTVNDGGAGGVTWTCVAFEGGQADIRVIGGGSGMAIQYSSISRNNCYNGTRGISVDWVHYTVMDTNTVVSTTAFTEANGAYNRWTNNTNMAGSSAVSGLAATSVSIRLAGPQAAIADAVGGEEVAKINSILAVLRTHGLIAT